jgi:hypothetical protein
MKGAMFGRMEVFVERVGRWMSDLTVYWYCWTGRRMDGGVEVLKSAEVYCWTRTVLPKMRWQWGIGKGGSDWQELF